MANGDTPQTPPYYRMIADWYLRKPGSRESDKIFDILYTEQIWGDVLGKIEDKGRRGGRTKRRGERKVGLTPGLERGVWPGQAKWHTRRQLRFGTDYKDIDLVQCHCQPTSWSSWYETTTSPVVQGPYPDGHTRGLNRRTGVDTYDHTFLPTGFFNAGRAYPFTTLSPDVRITRRLGVLENSRFFLTRRSCSVHELSLRAPMAFLFMI